MRKLIFFGLFCSIFILRWLTLASPLPETWTPDSIVRFTAPIIDQVEHTDTKTIVRHGVWYIAMQGYAEIIPGDLVVYTGTVEPQVLGGNIVRIVMEDPTFEVMTVREDRRLSLTEAILLSLLSLRERSVGLLEKWLPEPMSSLAAGILLGVKGQMPADFYQALVATGTLHIVAASGFNVSVVLVVLMRVALQFVTRGYAIFLGLIGVVGYVLLSGASASVVRAGIMGSLTMLAFYLGRPGEARRLLWVTAAVMLIFSPLMLVDIGFQLSVTATAGILYIEPWIRGRGKWISRIVEEYLWPTLAATLATAPVILWHFGRVSWISPLVNLLVLPLVPLIMGMTACVVLVGLMSSALGHVLAWLLYIPLWWVVAVIRWLG